MKNEKYIIFCMMTKIFCMDYSHEAKQNAVKMNFSRICILKKK